MSQVKEPNGEAPTSLPQDDLGGILREIEKAADDVEAQDAETRQKVRVLGERLHAAAVRGRVSAMTETFPLETNEYHPEHDVEGYLSVSRHGFHLATRSEWQNLLEHSLGPDGEKIYSVIELENWPVTWLRLIAGEERMKELGRALLAALRRQCATPNAIAVTIPAELELPSPNVVTVARELNFPKVVSEWQEAERELRTDPAGALRVACNLLETVCTHILRERSVQLPSSRTLPHLYKALQRELDLDNDEEKLASSLRGVVDGIAHGRSHLSDAHGSGPGDTPPTTLHAQLAVTASGALSVHLMLLHRGRITKKQNGQSLG